MAGVFDKDYKPSVNQTKGILADVKPKVNNNVSFLPEIKKLQDDYSAQPKTPTNSVGVNSSVGMQNKAFGNTAKPMDLSKSKTTVPKMGYQGPVQSNSDRLGYLGKPDVPINAPVQKPQQNQIPLNQRVDNFIKSVDVVGGLANAVDTASNLVVKNAQEKERARVELEKIRGNPDNLSPEEYSKRYFELASKTVTRTLADEYLAQFDPTAKSTASQFFNDQQQTAERNLRQGLDDNGNFGVDVGLGSVNLLAKAGMAPMTGMSFLGLMGVEQGGQAGQKALDEGANAGKATAMAVGSGAISAGIESVGGIGGKILGKSKIGTSVLNKLSPKTTEYIMKFAETKLGGITTSALSEGGEEFAEYYAQQLLENVVMDKNTPYDIKEALYNAGVGAVIGGMFGAVRGMSSGVSPELKSSESVQTFIEPLSMKDSGQQKNNLVAQKTVANIDTLNTMSPVATLTGKEFPKSEVKLTKQVGDFFRSLGNKVTRPNFGDVIIDEAGIQSDIAHGLGRAKSVTFAAVPNIIAKGKQIDHQKNWKGRGYDSYIFSAPIDINGEKAYVSAVVLKSDKNIFYLHEVVDSNGNIIYIKNEEPSVIKTGITVQDGVTRNTGSLINPNVSHNTTDVKNQYMQNQGENTQTSPISTPIRVGKATTIKNPYNGEVPISSNDVIRTKPVIQANSLNTAQNQIVLSQAKSQETGKSFRNYLSDFYNTAFDKNGGSRGIAVEGLKYDGKNYVVTLNKNAIDKVISDRNLSVQKIALFDIIDDVIENGEYVGSGSYEQHGKKEKLTTRFDYFETPVNINGNDYIATFDVEVFPNQNNYRTHRVINSVDLVSISNADIGPVPTANDISPSLSNPNVSHNTTDVNNQYMQKQEGNTTVVADLSLFDETELSDLNKARKKVIEYAKANFPDTVVNKDTQMVIGISRQGMDKLLSGNLLKEKYASAFHVPELIENARQIATAVNTKPKQGIGDYTYFDSLISIDEKDYTTHIRVRNTDMGQKYYGHTLSEMSAIIDDIKIEPSARSSTDKSVLHPVKSLGSNISVAQPQASVKTNYMQKPTNNTQTLEDTGTGTTGLYGENTVGAAQSKFKHQEKVSRFKTNTLENSPLFSKAQKDLFSLDKAKYDVVSEQQSMSEALNRVQVDFNGEFNDLPNKSHFDGTDTDTAMAILEKFGTEAEKAGENSMEAIRYAEWAKMLQERATEGGKMVQAFAKYSRTPEGVVVKAQSVISDVKENMKKSNPKQSAIIDAINLTAKDIMDIHAYTKKALEFPEGSYERAMWSAKADKIIGSKIPKSFKDKFTSYLMNSMLGNFRTLISRNAGGNLVFAIPETINQVPAVLIDKALSKFTGARTTAFTGLEGAKAYGRGLKTGFNEAISDYKNDVKTQSGNLDLDMKTGVDMNTPTFSDKWFLPRLGNEIDKLVSTALTMGDRPFYTAVFASRMIELQKIKEMGKLGGRYGEFVFDEKTFDEIAPLIARMDALEATFQNKGVISEAFSMLKKAIDGIGNGMIGVKIAGQATIPFPKTPGNIFERSIEYSPFGVVKNVVNTGKELHTGTFDQRRFANETGRNILGSMLFFVSGALLNAGLITGELDKDKDKRNAQYAIGMQPNSVKIGDSYYSYDWIPVLGPVMTAGAAFQNAYNNAEETPLIKGMGASLTTGVKTSAMQGVSRLFGGYDVANSVADSMLGGTGQLVPSIFRQASSLTDDYQRETYDPDPVKQQMNYLQSGIPVARNYLPPKIDTTGNPVYQNQGRGVFPKAFENMLSPSRHTTLKDDPLYNEAFRLSNSITSDVKNYGFPKTAEKNYTGVSGTEKFTAQEYNVYAELLGKIQYKSALDFTRSDVYKRLLDEKKAEELNNIYQQSSAIAKKQVLGDKYAVPQMYEKALKAYDNDVPLNVYAQVNSLKDYNGNGSVTQKEMEDALSDTNVLTDRQRAYLWALENKAWKPENNPFK